MFRYSIIALILCIVVCVSGCTVNPGIENQAYVLVLGIDILEDSMFELTIQIPKISSTESAGEDQSSNKGGAYLIISAKGDSYQSALERLKWSATREMNLSQIKMIVISENLATDERFSSVVSAVAETYHLYTAAHFVICRGNAKEFISGHETVLGARLSDELEGMFDHYTDLGYIPNSSFAEFYYNMHSFYSDPVAIWAFPSSQSESEAVQAVSVLGSDQELMENVKTPSSRHYLGAVVFKKGILSRKLDAEHTMMMNLLSGNLKSFNYMCNGEIYQFSALERPKTKITIENGKTKIHIKLRLSSIAQNSSLETSNTGSVIENEIRKTIEYCQLNEIEPFGFADKAALNYLTLHEWMSVDWHKMFADAEVEVSVYVMRADT